jgi:hypothetical protein
MQAMTRHSQHCRGETPQTPGRRGPDGGSRDARVRASDHSSDPMSYTPRPGLDRGSRRHRHSRPRSKPAGAGLLVPGCLGESRDGLDHECDRGRCDTHVSKFPRNRGRGGGCASGVNRETTRAPRRMPTHSCFRPLIALPHQIDSASVLQVRLLRRRCVTCRVTRVRWCMIYATKSARPLATFHVVRCGNVRFCTTLHVSATLFNHNGVQGVAGSKRRRRADI